MSLSLHAAAIGTFEARLAALAGMLERLDKHCESASIDPAAFLGARLFPDMFTLTGQVQLATDFANRGAARLAGAEPLSLPDVETSIAELLVRIARVRDAIRRLDPEAIEAGAAREVSFRAGPEEMRVMNGADYLLCFALPNFYFHVSMAYALMRHNGLAVGKRDFFGAI